MDLTIGVPASLPASFAKGGGAMNTPPSRPAVPKDASGNLPEASVNTKTYAARVASVQAAIQHGDAIPLTEVAQAIRVPLSRLRATDDGGAGRVRLGSIWLTSQAEFGRLIAFYAATGRPPYRVKCSSREDGVLPCASQSRSGPLDEIERAFPDAIDAVLARLLSAVPAEVPG